MRGKGIDSEEGRENQVCSGYKALFPSSGFAVFLGNYKQVSVYKPAVIQRWIKYMHLDIIFLKVAFTNTRLISQLQALTYLLIHDYIL